MLTGGGLRCRQLLPHSAQLSVDETERQDALVTKGIVFNLYSLTAIELFVA
jgi:hypothetical protein